MKKIIIFIFCLVFGFSIIASQDAFAASKITSINLKSYEELIASHKGKIVVVNFFATWCPPCREEIPGLVNIVKDTSKDVVVIGLSADENPRPLPSFIEKMNISYDIHLAEYDLLKKFDVRTIPHNLVYDQNGKLVANAAGFVTEEEVRKFLNALLGEAGNAKRDDS